MIRWLLLFSLISSLSFSQNPQWDSVGLGFYTPPGYVGMDTFQNKVVVFGNFKKIGNTLVNGVFLYNGVNVDSLKEGIDNTTSMMSLVKDVCSYHGKLYVGGNFTQAGTKMINNLAVWDGNDWDSLPASPNGTVLNLFVFNDELYVTGGFNQIGPSLSYGMAKWNDTTWTMFNGLPFNFINTTCAAVYNNELYIGGNNFSVPNNSDILKFDGTNWSIPGGGIKGSFTWVTDLQVYNNKLYVSGYFTQGDGNAGDYIMSWDGNNWQKAVNSIDYYVNSLDIYNGKLLAGGCFAYVNGVHTGALFMFDTVSFCSLSTPIPNCLSAVQNCNGTFLIGGEFTSIDTTNFGQIAQWGGGSYTDTCAFTVGVKELEMKYTNISLYPNPANDLLNISFQLPNQTKIQLTDLTGKIISETRVENTSGKTIQQLNISALSKGIYFVILRNAGEIYSKKFIKE